MKTLNRWLQGIAARQDVILAAMLLLAIFMMIVPLPTLLVDVLIAINLTLSITLLMMAVYIREPMEFSAFPAVLLITTLYRLALTISTSRLILLQHDAGEIVYTFGNFAVGGNLAVGLIVFAIITVVQFIVITKGSERVAEVSARFSLDGMPGKQMSIDGDMRAGIIDANEARRQRAMVQKESQLYGAMDGAMKFVKGDAIASIIVILVNIFGGIGVGVFMHDMSAGEAASTYAILSVGDGLIAQIPALLISIAAGIIVTRVPGEQRRNLASELSEQILRQRQALWIVSAVLVLFACLPGFPTLVFLSLAALVAGITYWLSREGGNSAAAAQLHGDEASADSAPLTIGATPLLLRLSPDEARDGQLRQALSALRLDKLEQLGLPLPDIQLQGDPSLAPGHFSLLLYQEPILSLALPPLPLLDLASPEIKQVSQRDPLPFGGLTLQWVSPEQVATISGMGLQCHQGQARIVHLVSVALDRYGAELIGVQEARYLMDQMEQRYGELVKELQRQLPVARVADVLQRLVAEGVSVRDLRAIFEALVEWAPREKDPVMLAEYARLALRRHIVGRQRRGQPWVRAWLVGGHIEQLMRESIRQTSAGSYSALSPEENQAILGEIRSALARTGGPGTALVTAIDVRRFIRKLIEKDLFTTPVLSFQEIDDEAELKVLGHIELIGETHAAA
ncbi:EscV/YscV/HrcV family type III secretion system export apparatus protein [Aeromonas veronii]|uniref:EscV/YscV/HrcV family type III secretion system export apparatus protein n=1 Tax=Aeromonas veronii TaxID=654 RepID=A0ABY3MIQ6_AERVE|nr:EscV/YscV/HrcV family type III secretion system export apparatus protein [Aeromonas veronii]MCF5913442.1 EscV/YscV/HrcV family type III secretion system export apparatus protein [Aeromonas veronii]QMS76425.1 EscV/YscV/HrcV family type III secretion system export apparatus protein [Aeromonas veronii Hm21]RDU78828.1 EscV/YscV/HrcV family type III secretion system export apparatus protein [Aeromonas veronii]RDU81953.1 EscV/YscV/HrcV family type III secretion system export apparatus protein [Aer